MVAALALMESPAMIIGLILVRLFAKDHLHEGKEHKQETSWGKILQEAF